MPASLDIVIVNWNAGDQLSDCVESIHRALKKGRHRSRIVVVDNASRDGSADGLNALGLPVTVIGNETNRGFAAACNQGARGGESDFILFLNPDTRLFADSLEKPLMFMAHPENRQVGIVGIQLVDEKGNIARSCARFPTPAMFFFRALGLDRLFPGRRLSHFMNEWNHGQSRAVDHVIGAFYFVRRSVFREMKGFDERFFVYLEDLDFSLRARRAGWKSVFLSDVSAFHKGGGTSATVKAKRLSYAVHSHILYCYKHFSRLAANFLTLEMLVLEPWLRIGFAIASRSKQQLRDTVTAYAMLWRKLLC